MTNKTIKRAVIVGGSSRFLFLESLLEQDSFASAQLFCDSFYASVFESRTPRNIRALDEHGIHSSVVIEQLKNQQIDELICLLAPALIDKHHTQLLAIKQAGIKLVGLIPDVAAYSLGLLEQLFSRFIVLTECDKSRLAVANNGKQTLVISELAKWQKLFRAMDCREIDAKLQQFFVGSPQEQKISNQPVLRVLMNIREGAFTFRGGDTVLIECLKEQLEKLGVQVTVDETATVDPANFDIVHTFNFATPEITENFAKRAVESGTPYVVTTLNEDRPKYFNQMYALFSVIEIYLKDGQARSMWPEYERVCSITRPGPIWDNSWTAKHASALIATGKHEATVLRECYPDTPRIEVVHLGTDTLSQHVDDGELFRKTHGVTDFVLCVGRLERRKNQLMLLKALEDTEHTIVFATSGMTYEPEYVEAVKNFQRRGKTIFLPALDKAMLTSAFAAARVHALPSWYELPGLVHLEAAQQGTAVVVTDFGTTRDYLGDDPFYCRPDNAASIRIAVEQAWEAAVRDPQRIQRLQARATSWKWATTAKQTLKLYQEIVSAAKASLGVEPAHIAPSIERASDEAYQASRSVSILPKALPADQHTFSALHDEADRICVESDKRLIAGDATAARQGYNQALAIAPNHLKSLKGLGVIALTEQEYQQAESYFDRAIGIAPNDAKAIAGKAACLSATGNADEAYKLYVKAVTVEPLNVSALYHLINASYELKKFTDLESGLRRYLVERSDDIEMRYCLAGCYVAQKKFPLALATIERILQLQPEHEQAIELRDEVKRLSQQARPEDAIMQHVGALNVRILIERIEDLKARKEHEDVVKQVELAQEVVGFTDQELDKIKAIKGESLACLQRLDEAQQCFVALVNSSLYGDRACAGLGVISAARGQWDLARGHFTEALRRNPKNDTALAGIALCDGSNGEKEKAWENYKKALGVNNENKRALLGLVELGYELQRLPDVEQALSKYLEMHPLDLSMLYTAAGCCYAQGKVDEALEKLNTIILVDRGHEYANELRDKIVSENRR